MDIWGPSTVKILAIDPGNTSGWAVGYQGQLVACGVARAPKWEMPDWVGQRLSMLVIERPQVYPGDTEKAASLITLAMTAGRFLERFPAPVVLTPHPREWKGSVPKGIHNRRVLGALTLAETRLITTPDHNMVDAIGLLKWAMTQ